MNKYRHYILYAKGFYKKTIGYTDLFKIQENYTGIQEHHLTTNDINIVLYEIVKPILFNRKYEHLIDVFLFKIENLGRLEAFLSFIKWVELEDLGVLGDPDPSILPIAEEVIQKNKEERRKLIRI